MIPFLLLLILIVLVAILIVLIRCCCDPKPDPEVPKGLDHFRVFDVAEQNVSIDVELTGQFDRGEPRGAKVFQLVHFANPVQKNDHKIIDKNAHLTWYRFDPEGSEPKRDVKFTNQFGEQHWVIGPARHLLVPTHKIEQGSAFPKNLDHFKCYEVLKIAGAPLEPILALRDQFGAQQDIPLGKPMYFCVPVAKVGGQRKSSITNPDDHLAVYAIRNEPTPREQRVENQFGQTTLRVMHSSMLCVPSIKSGWQEL